MAKKKYRDFLISHQASKNYNPNDPYGDKKREQEALKKQPPKEDKGGFINTITGGVKKAWDTIERVDSGWKTAHAQTIKNMRQNVVEDYQEKNKDKLKPADYLRPTHSSTSGEAFKKDQPNTFLNFLDSLIDKRNVEAFKEGYREKGKTTGKDIADLALPNSSERARKAFGVVNDIVDSPASIIPVMGAEKAAAKILPAAANIAGKTLPASKLANTALQSILAGGIHGTVRGVGQDKKGWDIAKSAAEDAALFGAMGVAGHGIGKAIGGIGKGVEKGINIFRNPKTGKVELVNNVPKDILQLPQSKIAGLLPEPKKTDFFADELGNVANIGPFPKKANTAKNIDYNYDPYNKIRNLPAVVPQPKSGLPAILEDLRPKKPTHFYGGQQGIAPTLPEYLKNVKIEGPKSPSTRPLPKNMEYDYRPNIEDRTLDFVKNKNIKPFSNEHPEIQPFIQEEAAYLLGDVMNAVKGQRHSFIDELGSRQWMGTKKFVSPTLDRIQIETGAGYNQVQKSLERIVNGEAKTPLDKQIELILDDNLTKGYKTMDNMDIPANQDYLKVKGTVKEKINLPKKTEQFIARLDEMEGQVRERINSRKGRLNSNPFEDLTDYSALGAIKIAKGTVKFADWSAGMVQEFGDEIKPYLKQIYDQAVKIHSTYTKEFKSAPVDPEKVANRARVSMDNIQVKKDNLNKQIKRFTAIYHKTTEPGVKNAMQQKIGAAKAELQKLEGRLGTVQAKAAPPSEGLLDGVNVDGLKDKSGFQLYNTDVYRNFEDVFGPQYEPIKKSILDPFDQAKKEKVELEEQWLQRLKDEIVDKLGINKDSELSAAVQRYGEGGVRYFDKKTGEIVVEPYTKDALVRDFPNDWQKIEQASEWFKKAYGELLDQINETRARIYPNNPDKLIPKRDDYFRHFRELNGLSGLKNIFETPANINANLAGISEYTNPKSKWQSFAQKRGYGQYKEDAVGGFLEYIPGASYATKIDPHISSFENLGKELASLTEGKNNMNNFIKYLDSYSKDLAGKTNPMDRYIQDVVGRKTMAVVRWINNRVKANTVLGNASSALAQLANIPQGIAHNKQYSIPGITKTFSTILRNNGPIVESGFLKERYGDAMYRQFNTKWIDSSGGKTKDMAAWIMETADKIGTHFIWNSSYSKGMAQGVADPIKYADDITRKLVAGRGIGEVPLMQKSVITQVFAPFTLEVSNLWRVQKDFVKAKDFGGLATLYLANYMFNRTMEDVKGSGVTFDPIKALQDAYGELEEGNYAKAGGRIAGEYLSNIPLGQYAAAAYPEEGLEGLPNRKELFGKADPTRFGTGPVMLKALEDPFYKFILPFGGNQVKKTISGSQAIDEGAVYNPNGKLRYPVEGDATNQLKALLFGASGAREAKDYYQNERQPLSDTQTQAYKQQVEQGKDPKEIYEFFNLLRETRSQQDKLKDSVGKGNPTSSQKAQNKQYNKKIDELEKILGVDKLYKEKDKASKKW